MRFLQQIPLYWFYILLTPLLVGLGYALWKLRRTLATILLNETAANSNPQYSKDAISKSIKFCSILLIFFCASILVVAAIISSLNGRLISAQNGNNGSPPKEDDKVTISVRVGESGIAFDNELSIKVNLTRYEGNPPRYKVFATILSPGYSEMEIEGVDTGFKSTYKAKTAFNIQVLDVTSGFARFLIVNKKE